MGSTTSYRYDVFLSFRGDIRHKFISHLYERLTCVGVRVFKDDEEMVEGEGINEALKTAIDSSRICMPIFSKNYASSKACLRELSHMVQECKSIIPVFYDVGVDDVKLKTDLYVKALEDHHQKGNVGKEEVENWKMALIEVCKILGYNIVNKNEANQITKITGEVSNRLKPKYQNVSKHFVEIDDQVESVIKLLDLNSNGCRIIGLYGMGGIGKTTLAKVVYNCISSYFNNCCTFIANVREIERKDGLPKLQLQLYKDLIDPRFAGSIDDVNCGINMIRKGLENKKFLLVLDDVDKEDLLKNFVGDHTRLANGSRIIITTRNKRILKLLEEELEVYEVQELDDDRALQLFRKCAFKIDPPAEKFGSLSEKVVSSLGGLPLALEVVGSSLCGRSMKAWEETMESLKETPGEIIQDSLTISYDRLNKGERNIFLDIACYPGRLEKPRACYMWASCRWQPNVSLDNLIDQSLVKVEVFRGVEWLWMHDVLKDFGRGIVRKECEHNGGTLERFLRVDENFSKISNEERKRVEMLQIRTTDVGTISSTDLEGFEKVRFIELESLFIEGNFEELFPNLRWIRIRSVQHFGAIDFNLENLVVLQLFSPYLEILDIQIKGNKLKVLDFSHCTHMKKTPSFRESPSLEMLILDWCKDLTEIDNSIGELKKLICLSMRECWSLQCLPEDIGDAKALEEIVLTGNHQRFKLPYSIGNLENLAKVKLIKLNMEELPATFGKLVSLSEMDLSYTHLLINSGWLKEIFDMSKLKCLSKLELIGCWNVVSIVGFDGLEYMEELCIRNLSSLSSLNLWNCKNLKRIVGFDGLWSLTDLSIRGCSSIEDFSFLYNLGSLSSLELWNCKYLKRMKWFKGLNSLIDLSIRDCPSLEELPFLPLSMRRLSSIELMDCKNLKGTLRFYGLETLRVLTLENLGIDSLECIACKELVSIEGREGLRSLGKLKRLIVHDCCSLAKIGDVTQLKPLEDINIVHCPELQGGAPVMKTCKILELEFIEELCIRGLRSLRSLKLWNCKNLKSIVGFDGLASLTDLSIRGCLSIEDFSFLYKLRRLSSLELCNCRNLERIVWFEELLSLINLSIRDCPFLEDFSFLSKQRCLSSLKLWNCRNLKRIDWIGGLLFLVNLSIRDCPSLEDISFLSKLRRVPSLELWNCRNLKRMDCFEGPLFFVKLSIRDCPSLEDFSFLYKLRRVSSLELWNCRKLKRMDWFEGLLFLNNLSIRDCQGLDSSIDLVISLSSLCSFELMDCKNLKGRLRFFGLPSFRVLTLENLGIDSLECIACRQLVSIKGCDGLQSLGNLKRLTLHECHELLQIGDLTKLKSLEDVSISHCPLVQKGSDSSLFQSSKCFEVLLLVRNFCPPVVGFGILCWRRSFEFITSGWSLARRLNP